MVKEEAMSTSFVDEMPLEGEQYSRLISERLSELLMRYCSVTDRARVHERTGIGISTIDKVAQRKHTLARTNVTAIVELVNIAIENCELAIEDAREAKIDLSRVIIKPKDKKS